MSNDNWDYQEQDISETEETATLSGSTEMYELKTHIHHNLMDQVNLKILDEYDEKTLRDKLKDVIRDLIEKENTPLNANEKLLLVTDIINEVLGLGPIEPLLADPTVSDILVNTYRQIYVERNGMLEKSPVRFQNDEHLMRIIDKIASNVGRRIDESSPMVDARLDDGSRVNAIIPPLAIDGPALSIRKFSVDPYTMRDLQTFKSITPGMAEFLAAAVKGRRNVLLSGGTGSGKTTLMNVMSNYIPDNERIISIEDAAELQLQQPHVIRLEVRPPNIEGHGEIVQRDLVKNALRMRPDRIIVGEVRGAEALDMLQAMNTGHDGSLTTIHANSPRDALTRLEHMVGMSGVPIPALVVRQQIAAALDLIVSIERLPDGRRVINSIQEITGMEENVVSVQEIFRFQRESVDSRGHVIGAFKATGIRPQMISKLKERGIVLDDVIFDPERIYE
ncbi:MAG: CpaF family protein [Gammaproteobacteria bacterium]|nr:CpaF family protein [Gammaproteobacteria bacterium]